MALRLNLELYLQIKRITVSKNIKNITLLERDRYRKIAAGSFARLYEDENGSWLSGEWFFCREVFQKKSQGVRWFLFSHRSYKGRNVAEFIKRVETKLKLKVRTEFGKTQRCNITWVKASPWWMNYSMRRSLFTALLRAGQNYNIAENNFEQALFSIVYTRHTKEAVIRFLAGNTLYKGRMKGWYNQFCKGSRYWFFDKKPDKKKIRQLLVKP